MSNNLRIDEEIKRLLEIKSKETGISQSDLANEYILEGLNKDKRSTDTMTIDEIKALLDYDKPEGNEGLNRITGIMSIDDITDSVKFKKECYTRRD